MHVELPIGAFAVTLLVLVPLPWHLRARNVSTLSITTWLFLSNLIYGVNSVLWSGNVRIIAPVWCDFVTKFQIGAFMALPSCSLCLCIHLRRISIVHSGRTVDREEKRVVYDLMICWLPPAIYMVLHFIVQGHRFDILEDFGCRPAIYNSVPAIFIVWLPPLLLSTLTLTYASLVLRRSFKQRFNFTRHLQNSHAAFTTSQYFRLLLLVVVEMFWGLFILVINFWLSCRDGLHPWTSWADVHDFSRIDVFPTRSAPIYVQRWTYFAWWGVPISSLIFFAFSCNGDVMEAYGACFRWVLRTVSRRQETTKIKKLLLPLSNQKTVSQMPELKINITLKTETWSEESLIVPRKEYYRSLGESSSFVSTA